MPAREVWGLDIGQTALHAVKVRRTKGRDAEIADIYFRALETEPEDPNYQGKVTAALESFVEEKKVGKTPLWVGLPGFTTLFREFPLPAASVSRLDEIVSYEAKQLIPYPLEEVIYDFHRLRVDMETGEITIALVCCRRDIIERTLAGLDDLGLNIDGLQVGPLALVNYVLYDTPPEGTALILDTGARGTDFIVLNQGSFWQRSMGISGTDLSKALMSKFSIPFDRAEALKREMGDSKQADRVFRVMAPVLNNLCAEVQRSVGYYKSLFRGVNLQEILCAGNTYLLAGVDQYIADNVGLPTRTFASPEALSIHFSVDPGLVDQHRQVLGIAAGLGLQGVGLAEVNTTLLPRERLVRKMIGAKRKWAAAALGSLALAVLVNWLYAGGQAETFKESIAATNRTQAEARKKQDDFKQVTSQFPTELEKSRALANVSKTRGFLLEATGALMAKLEAWNRARATDPQAKERQDKEYDLLRAEYHTRFELKKDADNYGDMRKNLEDQIRRRLDWQYGRFGRVFFNTIACKVDKHRRKANEKNPQDVQWLPAQGPIVPEAGFVIKDVPVVAVTIDGFQVITGDKDYLRMDKQATVDFRKTLEDIEHLVPGTLAGQPVLSNQKNPIKLPAIQPPKPADPEAAEEVARVVFEQAQEAIAKFTYTFLYMPQE